MIFLMILLQIGSSSSLHVFTAIAVARPDSLKELNNVTFTEDVFVRAEVQQVLTLTQLCVCSGDRGTCET